MLANITAGWHQHCFGDRENTVAAAAALSSSERPRSLLCYANPTTRLQTTIQNIASQLSNLIKSWRDLNKLATSLSGTSTN